MTSAQFSEMIEELYSYARKQYHRSREEVDDQARADWERLKDLPLPPARIIFPVKTGEKPYIEQLTMF